MIVKISKKQFFAYLICLFVGGFVHAQNLKTSGKKIINEANQEVILRGMGLGGWMIQEGYMLQTNSFANPQREIKAKIESLIGSTNTEKFYTAWLTNHCTRKDIDSLASWGFNSVRLPMHYNLFTLPIESEPVQGTNTWLEKGFALTDSLIKWCSVNHMYVILDLHAAPGGQGRDVAISDYDPSKPSLWESDANKSKTIALWKKLAERYVNEPWVGGYDLINEPNWNFTPGANQNGCSETTNTPLRELYINITNAIRTVDQKHIIFIEGNCWANNHSGLTPNWDNNMVVSFHKYWSYNDLGSIQGMINISNANNVPLWLGESGENSNLWFADAITLVESNNIGWSWWPLKKVESVVGPLSITKNKGYADLLSYWQNGGTQPTQAAATSALMQLTEDLKIENCTYQKDVIDAMFRQVNTNDTKSFTVLKAPGIVHATDYDLGKNGYAYFDTDVATYHVSDGGPYVAWNSGWSYRNDGVDIEVTSDKDANSNGFDVGWTADSEWIQYTLQVDSSAGYDITVRYAASASTSKIKLKNGSSDLTSEFSLPSSGGFSKWVETTFHDVVLLKGKQKLKIFFIKGGANLSLFKFSLSKKISELPFQVIAAETDDKVEMIYFNMNKPLDVSTLSSTGFTGTVNGVGVGISNLIVNPDNNFQLIFELDQPIYDSDIIKLNYADGQLKSTDGTSFDNFSNLQVKNNLPLHSIIPGKIEAENFSVNQGLSLETTTDVGGGQDVGYTNTGDYLVYDVRVTHSALYSVEVRSACNSAAGIIEVAQLDGNDAVLNKVNVNIPVTGGWQTWTTVKAKINLTEGISKIRVKILQPEFNLNWFNFSEVIISGTKDDRQGSLKVFPNPVNGLLNIEMPNIVSGQKKNLIIRSVDGHLIKSQQLNSMSEDQQVDIQDISKGLYIIEVTVHDKVWRNKIVIE